MHSDHPYFPRKPQFPVCDQLGCYGQNAPTPPVFDRFLPYAVNPSMPFHQVNIQPSEACPKNFVIFDQTNNRSQIMFHPERASNLFCPGFGVDTPVFESNVNEVHLSDDGKMASSFKENSDDINALLSTEYEEGNGECEDDDEVSTARTNAVYECNSPDSCSNYESPSRKRRSLFRKGSEGQSNSKRRQRMKKMVKALQGIVPGTNRRMGTVAVLDEAVRYLKSLRVEVQKLGVRTSEA